MLSMVEANALTLLLFGSLLAHRGMVLRNWKLSCFYMLFPFLSYIETIAVPLTEFATNILQFSQLWFDPWPFVDFLIRCIS